MHRFLRIRHSGMHDDVQLAALGFLHVARERDVLKDKILQQINLPVLRVATNGSGEREKLIEMLQEVVEESGEIEGSREE